MAGKTISVWLSAEDAERFQSAADARCLSLAAFLKRAAHAALATPDPRAELRAFTADLRADLRAEFAKVAEIVALNDERNRQSSDEHRRIRDAFLFDLIEQQKEAVKLAVGVGRQAGQAEALAKKSTASNGHRPPATPLE